MASTLESFDVGQCANMLLQRVDDKRFRDEGSLGKIIILETKHHQPNMIRPPFTAATNFGANRYHPYAMLKVDHALLLRTTPPSTNSSRQHDRPSLIGSLFTARPTDRYQLYEMLKIDHALTPLTDVVSNVKSV